MLLLTEQVTVSIVSHGQGRLVEALLHDLASCPNVSVVILTLNIPEDDIPCPKSLLTRLRIIRNECPSGFAVNHNQAFKLCETQFFAVINPDIRLNQDPFPILMSSFTMETGVIAPVVRNSDGAVEDSARRFPTLLGLFFKFLGRDDGRIYSKGVISLNVDWVAGMFLLFPSAVFKEIGGFDKRYYLYYEDVDICTRLWRNGRSVNLIPYVSVMHDAQRASRRNLKYMIWHFSSMVRYIVSYAWRLPR